MDKILDLFKKVILFIVILAFVISAWLFFAIPNVKQLKTHHPQTSAFMQEDPHLKNKYFLKNPKNFIELKNISSKMLKAVLVSEDDMFFKHEGFNWNEIKKSFWINIKAFSFERGASTISQQLVKNLYLSRSKNLYRKFKEAIITYALEKHLSKKRILELYLNVIEFGKGIYGIKNASEFYFHKHPSDLSLEESAFLVALLPHPKKYGKKPYPKVTYTRQRRIMRRVIKYGIKLPKM